MVFFTAGLLVLAFSLLVLLFNFILSKFFESELSLGVGGSCFIVGIAPFLLMPLESIAISAITLIKFSFCLDKESIQENLRRVSSFLDKCVQSKEAAFLIWLLTTSVCTLKIA